MDIPTKILIPLLLDKKIVVQDLVNNDLSSLHELLTELDKFQIEWGHDEESRAREELQKSFKVDLQRNLLELILLHQDDLEVTEALEIMNYLMKAGDETRSMVEKATKQKLERLERKTKK